MCEQIDDLLKRGYDYAGFAKQFLNGDNPLDIQHKLLAHFLFPNLTEVERAFLGRLRLVQALYSILRGTQFQNDQHWGAESY